MSCAYTLVACVLQEEMPLLVNVLATEIIGNW